MAEDVWVVLTESAQLAQSRPGRWTLSAAGTTTTFSLPPELSTSFEQLAETGLALAGVELAAARGDTGPLSLLGQLQRLWTAGLLVQVLRDGARELAVLRGLGDTPFLLPSVPDSCRITLAEDVAIRRRGGALLIESLERGAALELKAEYLFALPTLLMSELDATELARRTGWSPVVACTLVKWLAGIVAARPSERGADAPGMDGWTFADRLFHARSRLGRHLGGYGATFPLRGRTPSAPSLKPSTGARRVSLPVPDLRKAGAAEPSFTDVVEGRRSIREYDVEPITLGQLSEFLYRTARVKSRFTAYELDFITRPYPSGGNLHELEFYVIAQHCGGLAPALYRYNGADHTLEYATGLTDALQNTLRDARRAAPIEGHIQVMIVLTARFRRVQWKYESMAYALILKHVGIAYQTMYLVATAMGLAACALGGGNSADFASALQTSYWEESSVGEMLLGRPRPSRTAERNSHESLPAGADPTAIQGECSR